MIYPAGIDAAALQSAVAVAQAMASRIQATADAAPPDQPVAAALGAVDPGAALAFQQAWGIIVAVLRANHADANVDAAPLENNALDAQVAIGAGLQNLSAVGGPGGMSPWVIAGLVAGGLAVAGGVWWWSRR